MFYEFWLRIILKSFSFHQNFMNVWNEIDWLNIEVQRLITTLQYWRWQMNLWYWKWSLCKPWWFFYCIFMTMIFNFTDFSVIVDVICIYGWVRVFQHSKICHLTTSVNNGQKILLRCFFLNPEIFFFKNSIHWLGEDYAFLDQCQSFL